MEGRIPVLNDDDDDIYAGFDALQAEDLSDFLADSTVLDAVETLNKSRRPLTVAIVNSDEAPIGNGVDYLAKSAQSSPGGVFSPGKYRLQQQQQQQQQRWRLQTTNTNTNADESNPDPARTTMSRISTTRGAGFKPGTGGVRVTLSRGATGASTTRQGTARPGIGATASAGERPMTAITGAGFRSRLPPTEENPMNRGQNSDVPDFEPKIDEEEKKKKTMERDIRRMCQKCAFLSVRGEHTKALSLAKEAGKLERQLAMMNEPEKEACLTWLVLNNLSMMYAGCGATTEAINANRVILKSQQHFDPLWRLKTKLNTGVLYYRQEKYERAIKLFRMALDNITDDQQYIMRDLRRKTRRNIAICFIKMSNYEEAARELELNLKESPDFENGFDLIICFWLLGNFKEAQQTYSRMLQTKLGVELSEDKYQEKPNDKGWNKLLEVIRGDALRIFEKEKITNAHRWICMATKIIAKDIQRSHAEGFNWCIDQVKASVYRDFSADIDIGKAIHFLKEKDTVSAIATLKAFERLDHKLNCSAAINLSFLYFHERDYLQAAKYVDVAIEADRYNPAALVNKGVIYFREGKYEKSREFFREAIGTESTCVEALFNLGLANKVLAATTKDKKYYEDALECFLKLHNIVRGYPPVIYQIADLYEKLRDPNQCAEWFLQLQGLLPTDPGCLRRIGEIYDHDFQDKAQAFQYHMDSYRYFPSELETIEWLGAYYIESSYWEKAIDYFERAAVIQPDNSRWLLVIASCYRRAGNYSKALETYKTAHKKFPQNEECLKFIIKLASDLRLPEADVFSVKLKELEKQINKNKNRKSSANTAKCGSQLFSPRDPSMNTVHQVNDRREAYIRQKEIEQELDRENERRTSTIDAVLNATSSLMDSDADDSLESDHFEPQNYAAAYDAPSSAVYGIEHVIKGLDFFGEEDEDEGDDLPDALLPL